LQNWKARARALKTEVHALLIAARDPRTPWTAKALALLIVAYAASPIDLIPDFIPLLGYLDDLVLLPLGIIITIRLIPPEVLDEARRAAQDAQGRPPGWAGIVLIVLAWVIGLGLLAVVIIHFVK
jgi:uncharacterized membrane protein YkvA (DUF1232 family)